MLRAEQSDFDSAIPRFESCRLSQRIRLIELNLFHIALCSINVIKLAKIAGLDDPRNTDELAKIGSIAAAKQVRPEHFPASFDIV
jgi:hypothetical protein